MSKSKKIFLFFLFLFVVFVFSSKVFAQDNFLPSVPGANPEDIEGIGDLINYVYNLAFWGVGLAIFVQATRAGVKIFFAAGNTSKIGEGRTMITNAVYGFVLLAASWLILNVINPDLVKGTFDFSELLTSSGSSQSAPPPATQ